MAPHLFANLGRMDAKKYSHTSHMPKSLEPNPLKNLSGIGGNDVYDDICRGIYYLKSRNKHIKSMLLHDFFKIYIYRSIFSNIDQ